MHISWVVKLGRPIASTVWHNSRCMAQLPLRGTVFCCMALPLLHGRTPAAWHNPRCMAQPLLHGATPAAWHTPCCWAQLLLHGITSPVWHNPYCMAQPLLCGTALAAWHNSCCMGQLLQCGGFIMNPPPTACPQQARNEFRGFPCCDLPCSLLAIVCVSSARHGNLNARSQFAFSQSGSFQAQ